MKTYNGWMETDLNFKDYVQPGEEVDVEMVEYFMNLVPPRRMSDGYLQVGTAYSHVVDSEGKWRAIYATFAEEDGNWIYKGVCFSGETINRHPG